MNRFLSTSTARAFYDGFGARQDRQAFYEDAALAELRDNAGLDAASHVFEFGCGTGRLAAQMLDGVLPERAHYATCDLSATMVGLTRAKLARFGDRVSVWQSAGPPDFSPGKPPFDLILSTYVLDLLPPENIDAMVAAAAAALVPGGRLALVSLTWGDTLLSALTSWAWNLLHHLRPTLVGGCRPLHLSRYLLPDIWTIRHCSTVRSFSVPSEVVVAERK